MTDERCECTHKRDDHSAGQISGRTPCLHGDCCGCECKEYRPATRDEPASSPGKEDGR